MTKLTDSQLVILASAAKRSDGSILPLPESLKVRGAATATILQALLRRNLVDELPAPPNTEAWRQADDGQRFALRISDAGREIIGVGAPSSTSKVADSTDRAVPKGMQGARPKATTTGSTSAARPGTKMAALVALLSRKHGATIAEAMEATGWQAHSVRGAISGALKRKLQMAVSSTVVEGRGRTYRIAR